MSARAAASNLHGSAPDRSPVVLLVIDAINDFSFEEGRRVLADAYPVAQRIRRLKHVARHAGIATVDTLHADTRSAEVLDVKALRGEMGRNGRNGHR